MNLCFRDVLGLLDYCLFVVVCLCGLNLSPDLDLPGKMLHKSRLGSIVRPHKLEFKSTSAF
jgi:hypothetical protein